jgi:short-subunit dehydrogenase
LSTNLKSQIVISSSAVNWSQNVTTSESREDIVKMREAAVVTGAGSGIGREIARLLAGRGMDLVVVGRRAARLKALARELTGAHKVKVHILTLDLSKPGAPKKVKRFTDGRGFTVSVLVNNAGIGLFGEHDRIDLKALDGMLALNVVTLSGLCRIYGEAMRKRGAGRILNVASTAAFQPLPYMAAYAASKSFVLSLSEAMAGEMEGTGVTVSCLCPGPTDTEFFKGQEGKRVGFFAKGRLTDAKEVARIGVDMMFKGGTTRVVGFMNNLLVQSARLAPRKALVATAKGMLKGLSSTGPG